MTRTPADPDPAKGGGASPQQVADLLATFAPARERRRRRHRQDAPPTVLPLVTVPEMRTPLDPDRIEAARRRLREQTPPPG